MTRTNLAAAYASRLRSAKAAAELIPDGARVATGMTAARPPALLAAIAERARAGELRHTRLYYLLLPGDVSTTALDPALRSGIQPMSMFHGGCERAVGLAGLEPVDFVPVTFSQVPRVLRDQVGIDTLVTTVAPPDADGRFSLGTNIDYAADLAQSAARIIVEVNRHMPRVDGDCHIPMERITAIVEHDAPLLEVSAAPTRAIDRQIAAIVAALVDDGDCLQMGIGAVPDAVCAALHDRRRLGIHTELMTPALAELVRVGAVDGSAKRVHPGKSVFTFAMGDQALYDFLNGNEALAGYPVSFVNDPAVIAQNDRVFSVNATLQIDLQGACNSEAINHRQYSGSGGQLDFVRGAFASQGGRSIIVCPSTAVGGAQSRIVPRLDGPVTTPRTDVHIVATEYGWVDLKGLSLRERAEALIALAYPDFREDLAREAHQSHP